MVDARYRTASCRYPTTWGWSLNVFAPTRSCLEKEVSSLGLEYLRRFPSESSKQTARGQTQNRPAGASRFQQFTWTERSPVEGRNIPVYSPLFRLAGCKAIPVARGACPADCRFQLSLPWPCLSVICLFPTPALSCHHPLSEDRLTRVLRILDKLFLLGQKP